MRSLWSVWVCRLWFCHWVYYFFLYFLPFLIGSSKVLWDWGHFLCWSFPQRHKYVPWHCPLENLHVEIHFGSFFNTSRWAVWTLKEHEEHWSPSMIPSDLKIFQNVFQWNSLWDVSALALSTDWASFPFGGCAGNRIKWKTADSKLWTGLFQSPHY